ncbi:PQ-loop domain-containing transporter, partial [Raoultella ornithinolytica]|uniref:PQ-loop domain-containing transporter n=1 Tax=Raoultella ornithinolytica TaxID=54291 RepID=UPI000B4D8773
LSTVLLFCLLTVPSVVSFVPQLLRLARTGDTAGLSATALLTGCVNYTAWSVYLWPTGQAGLLVTNVLASLVWYALAALALRRLPLDGALGGPGCWALVVALAAGLRPDLLGLLLGLGTVLAHAPQAARAWTSPSL